MIRQSLAFRIFFSSLILITIPLTLYLTFVIGKYYREGLQDGAYHMRNQAFCRAYMVDEYTKGYLKLLNMIDYVFDISRSPPKKPDPLLNQKLREIADLEKAINVVFFLKEGEKFMATASSNPDLLGQDFSSYTYIQEAAKRDHYAFIYYGADLLSQKLYVVKNLRASAGRGTVGLLLFELSPAKLLQLLKDAESRLQTNFSIINERSVIFDSSNPVLRMRQFIPTTTLQPSTSEETLLATPFSSEDEVYEWMIESKKYIGAKAPVDKTNLFLLASIEKMRLVGLQKTVLYHLLALTSTILVVSLALALLTTRRISSPLNHLAGVMNKISTGDLTCRFKEDALGFEINTVGKGLNQMVDALLLQMEKTNNERIIKETYANELKIGRSIQMSIMPQQMPQLPGVDLAACAVPALDVGGDFYDIFLKECPGKENALFLNIADAAGKGISACLYSLCLRSMLRSYAVECDSVAEILVRANSLFLRDTESSSMFVTVFAALYLPWEQKLLYSSCGHLPGLVVRMGGDIEELQTPSMAIGVQDFKSLSQSELRMEKGDLLLLYTDGVTESHNENSELYGMQRLKYFLNNHRGLSAGKTMDLLLQDLQLFCGTSEQHDDITMLFLRVV